jgi:phenylacetate-CoA ligase
MYSIFHMSEKNLPHYVKALDSRYSHFYWGYPSAIYTIADYMKRNGLRLERPPEHVLAASEELQPHYAETIAEVFGARVSSRYGLNELCGSITTYDCGHLHYDMDYSILEFVEVEGSVTDQDGDEKGVILAEVLGTNMHDHAWPLLRYRTGDLVEYHPDDRCEAGHPGRIVRRIHGRSGRYFELPDGSRVTNISVIAKKCTKLRQMQVVQREVGSIVVRVVRDEGFETIDADRIVKQFRRKVGDDLRIELEYVDDIERTKRGKFISIINETEDEKASVV